MRLLILLFSDEFVQDINQVLHDDVGVQKTALGLRHQRCYAVKVRCLCDERIQGTHSLCDRRV